MNVGDSILVCNAGDETVDLAAYRIKRLPPDLQVEEYGIPSRGKCGSVFISRIFEKWIDTELGVGNSLSDTARAEMVTMFGAFVSVVSCDNAGRIPTHTGISYGLPMEQTMRVFNVGDDDDRHVACSYTLVCFPRDQSTNAST